MRTTLTLILLGLIGVSYMMRQDPPPPAGHPFAFTQRQYLMLTAYLDQARLLGWNDVFAMQVACQVLGIQYDPANPIAPVLARLPQ